MIRAKLYYDNDTLMRFKIKGHAGYAAIGSDIVCASVSMLVFNTVNAITEFTDEPVSILKMDFNKGFFDCKFSERKTHESSEEADLLLKAMILGLDTIQKMYGEKYIQVEIIRR